MMSHIISTCALPGKNKAPGNLIYWADVEAALHKALKKMDIKETTRKAEEGKVSVTAITTNLDIYIDLEKVTPTVTNIEVTAKKGVFFKDKAMATEIIVQTEKNLEMKK